MKRSILIDYSDGAYGWRETDMEQCRGYTIVQVGWLRWTWLRIVSAIEWHQQRWLRKQDNLRYEREEGL